MNNQEKQSMNEKLIGSWRLVRYKVCNKNGKVTYPLGEDADGIAIYHEDGHMSVQIMSAGRLSYAGGDLHSGPQKAVAAAANGYLAYSGSYQLDPEQATIEQNIKVSLNPNWEGDTQLRYVRFRDDQMVISSEPVFIQGERQNNEIVWERLN
ncbi:lipocalin-like domain-containing protein [Halobacillus salinus]|uniref:Lipocalin-like domain-containing protein n=1 Tax=Halobacillus salinus TaxID=192814 RepID=A0A4Z0GV93_9BACI|nr:lipocalin-like domain-containing protein [Halobacillus salinus]TGB01192.1 lipocalin-like domain-containing protein [Halobacillus salinus]